MFFLIFILVELIELSTAPTASMHYYSKKADTMSVLGEFIRVEILPKTAYTHEFHRQMHIHAGWSTVGCSHC